MLGRDRGAALGGSGGVRHGGGVGAGERGELADPGALDTDAFQPAHATAL